MTLSTAMTLSVGTRVGPYQIQSLIGTGGMGAVYKAYDTRLQRVVAIKQLSVGYGDWFEREARAIAALNHPHVCQIYDIGEDYLVLEYIEGRPVSGPLEWQDALRLALQIADALVAAHARGVLHRDLKPANIVVTEGEGPNPVRSAKLLDFGIARVTQSGPGATQTATSSIVGTPAYMSPEQAEGKTIDERSDVFSFGAVLYELLGGHRAFPGDSTAHVLSAVLRDEPAPLAAPAALSQVVLKCLAKNPAKRFQTMVEVKSALEDALTGRGVQHRSIAVLPLATSGTDKENEGFADGLTEEIINALARVGGLKVIARTSVFAFKGRNEDVRRIADALGVTHVLEGSVRRAGDRIRVTVQLVTALDGSQLWSDRFDRPLTDVFAIQDEIAQAIATALQVQLGEASIRPRRHTPLLRAYEPFLRGRHHLIRFSPEEWRRAKDLLEQAITEDPDFAEPHAELAMGYFIAGMHGIETFRQVAPRARAEAERALALNPSDPRPRFVLAGVALANDYNWRAAEDHFRAARRATDISPDARWLYSSLYLAPLGKFAEASAEMGRAAEQDPMNAMWRAIWSATLLNGEKADRALEEGQRAVELDPHHVGPRFILGEALAALGRVDEALAQFEMAYEMAPWQGMAAGLLAATLVKKGDLTRAESIVARMGPTPSPVWGRVLYHLHLSQIDDAAEWYEKMIEARDPFALVYANAPITAPLRAHPRWGHLASLMYLPVSI
jgi:TolB-like protein/predicted Ser/Thr protein kinase